MGKKADTGLIETESRHFGIDPLFNSNRNGEAIGEVFWGETKEKRAFDDRHVSTMAHIDYMRPCVGWRGKLKAGRRGAGH